MRARAKTAFTKAYPLYLVLHNPPLSVTEVGHFFEGPMNEQIYT